MSTSLSDCLATYNTALISSISQLSNNQPAVSSVITSTILFGFVTCLAFASIYALRTVEHRVIRISCLCAIVSLYASTTCFWLTIVIQQVIFANSLDALSLSLWTWPSCSDHDAPEPYTETLSNSQAIFLTFQVPCIQTAALTINVVVGDAIVWWRACSLWTGKTKLYHLVLCVALLLATFSLTVADTCEACSDSIGKVSDKDPYNGKLFVGARLGAVAAVLSLVTNLGATISISYKTWEHRRIWKLQSSSWFKSDAQGILMLFMESGILYCILWVFVATYLAGESNYAIAYSHAAQRHNSFWYTTGSFVAGCLVPLIAIYPMAIIVIVAMKKSAMQQVFISNSPSKIPMTSVSNSTTSQTMVVNVNTETTTDQDSVIFIRNMYHKDTEQMECHTAGDVRESDMEV